MDMGKDVLIRFERAPDIRDGQRFIVYVSKATGQVTEKAVYPLPASTAVTPTPRTARRWGGVLSGDKVGLALLRRAPRKVNERRLCI